MNNSAESKQSLKNIQKTLTRRLPWLAEYGSFFIGNNEGYDGHIFGSCAGPYDNTNVDNVLHEVSHAIELTLLRTQDWHRRVKMRNFGMRIKTFQTVNGIRYPEPNTTQATERECRTYGIQLRLLEDAGYKTNKFIEEAAITLKYTADYCVGSGSCPYNSHDPDSFSLVEKEWVRFRTDLIMESYNKFSIEDIKARWNKVMLYKNSQTKEQ